MVTTDNVLTDDTHTITGFTQGDNGTVVNNGDGTFSYTPNDGFSGTDSFSYTVYDGVGGTDAGGVNVNVNVVVTESTTDGEVGTLSTTDAAAPVVVEAVEQVTDGPESGVLTETIELDSAADIPVETVTAIPDYNAGGSQAEQMKSVEAEAFEDDGLQILDPMDDVADTVEIDDGREDEELVQAARQAAFGESDREDLSREFTSDRDLDFSDFDTVLGLGEGLEIDSFAPGTSFDNEFDGSSVTVALQPATRGLKSATTSTEADEFQRRLSDDADPAETSEARRLHAGHEAAETAAQAGVDSGEGFDMAKVGFFAKMWGLIRGSVGTAKHSDIQSPADVQRDRTGNRRS